jgi:lipopolysaccharide biosynthesis regulator YciM
MENYVTILVVLVTLLVGLATGKAWERYKLREGQWIDRRKMRESPHFILGLNFLVSNQLDRAIDELARAARIQPDATEIEMILGNLYREKGQVGRAITIHQGLQQRPKLTRLEQAYVLLCLGIDYKRGGFVDRALEAFTQVLHLDPKNPYALANLEKLHEEQHQWEAAREVHEHLMAVSEPADLPRHQQVLAFLENELGLQAVKLGETTAAAGHFAAAIDRDAKTVPAYLNLGDVRLREGQVDEAAALWLKVANVTPELAYLTFERLAALQAQQPNDARFEALCRRLIEANPKEWRARTALAEHLLERGNGDDALVLLLEALSHNPHALTIHEAIWRTLMATGLDRTHVQRYVDMARQSVFYLDPHVCQHCHYRSTELLWQCPHCHEWDSFVEDRISAAQDATVTPVAEAQPAVGPKGV